MFQQFGSNGGQLAFYFHGVPGAASEAALFDLPAKMHGIELVGIDRFAIDSALKPDDYFRHIAAALDQYAAGRPFTLLGFSIGAAVALRTSKWLSGRVQGMHLISAAAPLQAGPFLDQMAGKQVFRLARSSPLAFSLLTRWQGLLASVAPTALFKLLFASAAGGDRELIADATFRQPITDMLKICFRQGMPGYLRDIQLYVQPWQHTLADVTVPTCLWHGDVDNWSPLAMADYLREAINAEVAVHRLPGLSHYSCLFAAVPAIFEELNRRANAA